MEPISGIGKRLVLAALPRAGRTKIRSYSSDVVDRVLDDHEHFFVLQSKEVSTLWPEMALTRGLFLLSFTLFG